MRTNYSTPPLARSKEAENPSNGGTSQTSAWIEDKPSVIDRHFSDADQWPSSDEGPTAVVSTSTAAADFQTETDSSYQGYFAEWINEADSANEANESASIAAGPIVSSVLVGGPTAGVGFTAAERPAAPQRITQTVTTPSPIVPPPEAGAINEFSVERTVSEPAGIEELARQTGGYEALAPESLAVEQPETTAFDQRVLAHDWTHSTSFERPVERETGRTPSKPIESVKEGAQERILKVLGFFGRSGPKQEGLARRTVDHPHLLNVEHSTPYQNAGPEGSPRRKAAMLGLVSIVALAAVSVSVQRSRSANPAFEVASSEPAVLIGSEAQLSGPNVTLDSPTSTRVTVAPNTTAAPEIELESRKARLLATAVSPTSADTVTTVAEPTTTRQPATTAAQATTVAPPAPSDTAPATAATEATEAEATTTSVAAEGEAAETEVAAAEAKAAEVAPEADTTAAAAVPEVAPAAPEVPTTAVPATPVTAAPTPVEEGWVDSGNGVSVPAVLLDIRHCESRGNYSAANPASSARGAYQFLTGSWKGYGHAARYGVTRASDATPAQQDEAALKTWQADGTRPWNASKSCWSKNPVA